MRRAPAEVRRIDPDPVFRSVLVSQVVNKVLWKGKKSRSRKIVYDALEGVREKTGNDPVVTLRRAVDNVRPTLEVRSRRVGGATYQVPVEVRPARRQTLAMRWVIDAARRRSEKSMAHRLAHELLDAAENRGTAVKKKEDTHRMAEANKAFSHYRW